MHGVRFDRDSVWDVVTNVFGLSDSMGGGSDQLSMPIPSLVFFTWMSISMAVFFSAQGNVVGFVSFWILGVNFTKTV